MRNTRHTVNIGILVSGRGSNMEAIIKAVEEKKLHVRISIVISNKKDAPALEKAKRHGIKTVFLDPNGKDRNAYDTELVDLLNKYKVYLVVLAGYMRIVTPTLLSAFPNRVMNIHPALLPSFPGTNAQEQALEYGVKISGCTVHFVDEGCDTGPIIMQKAVPVKDDDTVESLSQRILKEEHKLYPECIKAFVEERIEIRGRRVLIR